MKWERLRLFSFFNCGKVPNWEKIKLKSFGKTYWSLSSARSQFGILLEIWTLSDLYVFIQYNLEKKMSRLRKHFKKSKKTKNHPLTILTNLGAWISRQKVEFNAELPDSRTLVKNHHNKFMLGDTCIALVYDRKFNLDMSDDFWEHANGCRYVVRMNISLLGFDFDDVDEFIGTDDPSLISSADLALRWGKLVNYVFYQDDEDLFNGNMWNLPFSIKIERGKIYMCGIEIGEYFSSGGINLIDYGENTLYVGSIPEMLCSFIDLYFPTYRYTEENGF